MKEWIAIAKELPKAVFNNQDHLPIISDDVLILFESGIVDVANYDHEVKRWSMVNHGFKEPECDPLYWTSIPELPNGMERGF